MLKSGNPFSPDFGRPPVFYGRDEYVEVVREAMLPGIRANRALLVEGIRGTGKTALLCHLQDVAEETGWESIYTTSVDAANSITHDLAILSERNRPTLKSAEVHLPLVSATLETEDDDQKLWSPSVRHALVDHMREARPKGLLILIDEMQKISQRDAQAICDAVITARTHKDDIALVMAGLPGTLKRIEKFPKCTYMVRSVVMELEPLSVEETREALAALLGSVREIDIDAKTLDAAADFTKGHPYLLQLVGYHLYRAAEESLEVGSHVDARVRITETMLADAESEAWANYSTKVLDMVFGNLGAGMIDYLNAITVTMDADGVMASGREVAESIDMDPAVANSYRTRLKNMGIIHDPSKGKLVFTIPYIPRYLKEGATDPSRRPHRRRLGTRYKMT